MGWCQVINFVQVITFVQKVINFEKLIWQSFVFNLTSFGYVFVGESY